MDKKIKIISDGFTNLGFLVFSKNEEKIEIPKNLKPFLFYFKHDNKTHAIKSDKWNDLFPKVAKLLYELSDVEADTIFDDKVVWKRVKMFSRTEENGYFKLDERLFVRNLANTDDVYLGISQLLNMLKFAYPQNAALFIYVDNFGNKQIPFNDMDSINNSLINYLKDKENYENKIKNVLYSFNELDETLKNKVKLKEITLFEPKKYSDFVNNIKEALMLYRGNEKLSNIVSRINIIISATYGENYATLTNEESLGSFIAQLNPMLTVRFSCFDKEVDIEKYC